MDPYLANLNFDPPRRSSELAVGFLPALLVNAAFFGIVLLGAQSGDFDPSGDDPGAVTREMGGPAAPPAATVEPASVQPASPVVQAAPVKTAPPAAQPAPAIVARADPQAGSPPVTRPAAATPRVAPSFDCRRAHLKTDKLICADAELSQMDHDLGRLYAQAKAAAPDPAAFKRASDREWSRREAECKDQGKECLRQWYVVRRAQLQASLEGRRQATGSATR